MWYRQILLLLLAVVVVEPRPSLLHEEIPQSPLVPFNFGYEVRSEKTGDTKTHQEVLEDDGVLRGSYTVVQPDGLRRIVKYTSDAENGFRADVTYEKGYENVIPQALKHRESSSSVGSFGLFSSSQGNSLSLSSSKTSSSSSGGFTLRGSSTRGSSSTGFTKAGDSRGDSSSVGFNSGGSSSRGSPSIGFSSGGATRGGSASVGSSSGGSSTRVFSSTGFTSGGASSGGSSSTGFSSDGGTRGVSSSVGFSSGASPSGGSSSFGFASGGLTRKGSSTVGLSLGENSEHSSINSAKPFSGSFSVDNVGSLQGLTSSRVTSSNSQISDIRESGHAQFTAHIAPSSSHTISSGSPAHDITFTNNNAATSSGDEINVGTANLPQKDSFGDIYNNRRQSCAGCNTGTGSFESSRVSSNTNTATDTITATVGSSSLGFTSEGTSTGGLSSIGSTSEGATRGGPLSAGFTSGVSSTKESSSIGFSSGVTEEGFSSVGFTSGGSTSRASSAIGSTSGAATTGGSSTGGSSNVQFTSRGSTTGGLSVGGADFSDIFSRSFLVASENLDNVDAVQLSNAGIHSEQLYAYKLVPIKIVGESTTV